MYAYQGILKASDLTAFVLEPLLSSCPKLSLNFPVIKVHLYRVNKDRVKGAPVYFIWPESLRT